MALPEKLPLFDELPISVDKPPYSAWGVFGDDDQIGTINLLTPARVAAAAQLVRTGQVFPLNWELELPDPPLFRRPKLQHTILTRRWNVCDDVYNDFNPQSSSQWDGLTHYGHPQHGFYNGVQADQITGQPGTRNGIEHWARRGIAGRAVLVDFARYAAQQGLDYQPYAKYEITASDIQAAAQAQGVTFQEGDILMLRTGWMEWYTGQSYEQRAALSETPNTWAWAGLQQSEDSLRFLWNNHFAAVCADCPSFECFPPASNDVFMHATIIAMWGMPIGEMFNLEALAANCAQDGVYQCFLTAAPLNKLGGVASPPNALCIK